jgi:OmpA-OmpF porin, OOP family
MLRARRPLGALAILALGSTHDALAQMAPSLDIRTWRPSMDPEANLILEPPTTPGPWRWSITAWGHYAHEPIAPHGAGSARPVEHLVGADLVAGLGVGERLSLGIDVPAFVWQDGTTSLPPALVTGGKAPTTGIGDVSLLAKAALVSNDRGGVPVGLGLALLDSVSLPTGDRASFAGDGDVTASFRLLAEYAIGPAALRGSIGYSLRTAPHAWPDAPPPLGGPKYGAGIPWSIGVALRPKAFAPGLDSGDRQAWELAAHGAVPAGPVAPITGTGAPVLSPALLAVDDRISLGHYRDAYAVVGADVGLDDAVGVPVVRAVLAFGWAPRSHDQDADGVPDDVDECPDLPEDRDGIQDQDGCPEDDADADGVLDTQDACPLVAGTPSPDPKRNGCPRASEEKK